MLTIELKHELPDAFKPRRIEINEDAPTLECKLQTEKAA
jgi:hypothetical protein